MGQSCSCLQHRRKLERRASDEDTVQDTDGTELDILIDDTDSEFDELLGGSGSGSVRFLRNNARAAFMKRSSKNIRVEVDDNDSGSGSGNSIAPEDREDDDNSHYGGNAARLLGARSNSSLSQEKSNMEVLRSYQKATGMVDEGEQDLECIMCLDIFSPDNPKVRTLCNCGMNRTNFHMSCLMEWKNRNAKCPVCREYLFYED